MHTCQFLFVDEGEYCGEPAVKSILAEWNGRAFTNWLCDFHYDELNNKSSDCGWYFSDGQSADGVTYEY